MNCVVAVFQKQRQKPQMHPTNSNLTLLAPMEKEKATPCDFLFVCVLVARKCSTPTPPSCVRACLVRTPSHRAALSPPLSGLTIGLGTKRPYRSGSRSFFWVEGE